MQTWYEMVVLESVSRIRRLAWIWFSASSLATCKDLTKLIKASVSQSPHLILRYCYLIWLLWELEILIWVIYLCQDLAHNNHYQNVTSCYYKNLEAEVVSCIDIKQLNGGCSRKHFLQRNSYCAHMQNSEFQSPTRDHCPPSNSTNS